MAGNNPLGNAADISGLIENIKTTGLAYSNRYEVVFNTPRGFGKTDLPSLRSISLRCDSIAVPGRAFSTTPYRFYGPARNMPYEPVYSGELSLSIILSEDLRERTFFEMWMEKICNRTNYKFGYYDDYVTDLQIMPLNKSDAISYEFIVEEAYPKAIGDLQLAYDKENDYLRQEITMCFRKYTPRYIGIQQQPISPNIPPAQIPGNALGPQAPFQSFINDNGRIDRVGLDGSVNGFFSPRN
jgi:hypothetical protein